MAAAALHPEGCRVFERDAPGMWAVAIAGCEKTTVANTEKRHADPDVGCLHIADYADNNPLGGGAGVDLDGDGNAGDLVNSDEFIVLTNNAPSAVDISGYELYSSGTAYHTFPPGTVLQPGDSITVITNYNDPAGTPGPGTQQANAGDDMLDPSTQSGFAATDTVIADNANGPFFGGSGWTNSAFFGGDATVVLVNGPIASASEALRVTWETNGVGSDPANYNGGGANGFGGTIVDTFAVGSGGNFPDADVTINFDNNGNATEGTPEFPCFGRGALIETVSGKRRVEDLRAEDRLVTRDHGVQKILWIGSRRVTFRGEPDEAQPILLQRDCIAPGLPCADLQLSPQHRVPLCADPAVGEVVLGLAKGLTGLRGVRRMKGCRAVEYFTILLERHAVIYANDLAVESFYPGPWGLKMIGARNRAAVLARILGARQSGAAVAYGPMALPPVTYRKTRALITGPADRDRLLGRKFEMA